MLLNRIGGLDAEASILWGKRDFHGNVREKKNAVKTDKYA